MTTINLIRSRTTRLNARVEETTILYRPLWGYGWTELFTYLRVLL
jgi:hypothetical protein